MYVCHLSFTDLHSLASILDSNAQWERLAALMKFSMEEVIRFRHVMVTGESPTIAVITKFGSLGYTVNSLFKILGAMKCVRAMLILFPYVDDDKLKMAFEKLQIQVQPATVAETVSNSASSSSADVVTPPSLSSLEELQPVFVQSSPGSGSISLHADVVASLQATLAIPYSELDRATAGFSKDNILGRGGYGVVFKANWKHTCVAVKRLSPPAGKAEAEQMKQSLSELKSLALYRHDNILPLYGYSFDGPEPCLVYQYMSRGSLEDRLRRKDNSLPLTWSLRHQIMLGAARGINFLHTCTKEPLLHGDIKSGNILLDDFWHPKIGDFGLARKGAVEMPGNANPMIASHIKGTWAYLPPEFIRHRHLSTKLDVFSFGVVLFEVATGEKAYSEERTYKNLVDFVKAGVMFKGEAGMADATAVPMDKNLVSRFLLLGQKCTHVSSEQRPSMLAVLSELSA